VEGILTIWYDNPEGRNPGNIQDYERRDDTDTDILFATNVTVRVKSDGWIVAWHTNDRNISDIVFWNDANTNVNPSDTTIGKAIWRITNRVGINYDKNEVKYYSYMYPAADRLLIGGRMTYVTGVTQEETYHFLIPSATTVYNANLTWTAYLSDPTYNSGISGILTMDDAPIYSKSTTGPFNDGLYEYARYSKDLADTAKDRRHTVYIKTSGHSLGVLKSAVVILYQSG
jgi:hypothetical protein